MPWSVGLYASRRMAEENYYAPSFAAGERITLTSIELLTIWIETVIFIVVIFIGVIMFSKIALLEPFPIKFCGSSG
jgi:hypothetical protein